MVERYRRRKHTRKLLGNHQKCWIWGRHVVAETLQTGHWPIHELVIDASLPADELQGVRELAQRQQVPVRLASSDELRALCKSSEHQGYLAKMPPFPYSTWEDVLNAEAGPSSQSNTFSAAFAILDSLQDPYNFGAILRSAAALGINACFVAKTNQCEVTSLVARASAGAVNLVPIVQVDDLAAAARELQARGVRIVGTAADATCPASEFDFQPACAVVIGNEGIGIRPELLAVCDAVVSIPQHGRLDSLNAAVSAGILFYEIQRQRSAAKPLAGRRDIGTGTA